MNVNVLKKTNRVALSGKGLSLMMVCFTFGVANGSTTNDVIKPSGMSLTMFKAELVTEPTIFNVKVRTASSRHAYDDLLSNYSGSEYVIRDNFWAVEIRTIDGLGSQSFSEGDFFCFTAKKSEAGKVVAEALKDGDWHIALVTLRYSKNPKFRMCCSLDKIDVQDVKSVSQVASWTMPTKEEIKRVQPLVNELMSAHFKSYSQKKETAKEVGDAAAGLAKEAEGVAARYILLKCAIYYYTLAKEYDLVADVLELLRNSVKGIPEEEVASLALNALNRTGRDEAQRLKTIYRIASMRSKAEADVKSFRAAFKRNPSDTAALRGLADAYVRLGDWPKALKVFSKLGIKAAKFELNPEDTKDFNVLKAADYWWEFKAKNTNPYRAHAATLYRKAIADDLVKGLMKSLVEKRIAEVDALDVPVPVQAQDMVGPRFGTTANNGRRYCIIDLSPGPNAKRYPVKWRDNDPPSSGWTDEYKTTKLVLRRINAGSFIMGEDQKDESHRVTLTKPFYIGVFEVTQRQYELVMGSNPANCKGYMRPIENISYEMILGKGENAKRPAFSAVDLDSFIGKISMRTGLAFDLPNEAQWEYACRAGTKSAYNNGGSSEDDLKQLGRFALNQKAHGWRESMADFSRHRPDGRGGHSHHHTVVGSYRPNAWGLYDMHGNVWEWCRPFGVSGYGADSRGSWSGSDRVILRGGSHNNSALDCRSDFRNKYNNHIPSFHCDTFGFRLCCSAKPRE